MKPHVILITLDSVRADRLGCYGYGGVDTANIDRLAAEGALFRRFYAQAPNTWVSHACIFTGLNPYRHGVRRCYDALFTSVPTMAEIFRANGYRTVGFPANTVVGAARGFARGFDLFDEEDFVYSAVGKRRSSCQYFRDLRRTQEKLDRLLSRPEGSTAGSLFLWFHYMGTHREPGPGASVPEEFRKGYSPEGQSYDAKVSYADRECVGFLLDRLPQGEPALVVVTSDHGENLRRLAFGGHNDEIEEAVVRVPFIIWGPGIVPSGVRVRRQASSVDILPTLIDVLGLEPPPGAGFDGASQKAEMFRGEAAGGETTAGAGHDEEPEAGCDGAVIYMENLDRGRVAIQSGRCRLVARVGRGWRPRPGSRLDRTRRALAGIVPAGLRDRMGKIIVKAWCYQSWLRSKVWRRARCGVKGRRMRPHALYDMGAEDPEERNLVRERPEVAAGLLDLLRSLLAAEGEPHTLEGDDRAQVEESLRRLGYL